MRVDAFLQILRETAGVCYKFLSLSSLYPPLACANKCREIKCPNIAVQTVDL